MAKYKAYPEYKDSGVEWLGEVPSHWEMLRHKYVAFFTKGKNPTNLLEQPLKNTLPYLSMECLRNNTTDKYALISNDVRVALEGQPLIIWDGSNAGEFVKGKSGILSSTMAAATLTYPLYSQYYWYLCISIEPEMRKNAVGMGIPHVNGDELKSISFGIPSIYEQKQVAEFLDHETAKIDNLIEKQQQLIELLKEKRQAVISHAVTKGLNLDVPMKDSGVEWLGEVPEHWKLIKFSHCVSIRSGQVDPRKLPYCNYWLIAPNHIVSGEGRIINLETAKEQGADSGKYLCRTGEVIYSKIRPALVKACLSPSDTVLCSADMYPMSSYNGLTNNFLLLYLLSDAFTRFAVNQADRVAMPKINRESLSDCKIPVPPIEEQEKIYSYAREALEKLDVMLQKSLLTIEFLKERRTALISAAVTGKIDVRDWVAPDTQDVEEPQEATA